MKNYFILALVFVLLLSASFSLATMAHVGSQFHVGCPFQVADCAQTQNPLEYVSTHINAFSGSFSATSISIYPYFLLLLLAVFLISSLLLAGDGNPVVSFKFSWHQLSKLIFSPRNERLLSWFSLHENSPAFIAGR